MVLLHSKVIEIAWISQVTVPLIAQIVCHTGHIISSYRQLPQELILGIQHFVLTTMYGTGKLQLLKLIQTNGKTGTFQNEQLHNQR